MTAAKIPTVAVVDDDVRVLEAMEDLLESAGHAVRLYSSAQSFLEDINVREIDCLIADIDMRGTDGFELRRLARCVMPNLPVIFITARHVASDVKRAAAEGHQGLFRKPFDDVALLRAVTLALATTPRNV